MPSKMSVTPTNDASEDNMCEAIGEIQLHTHNGLWMIIFLFFLFKRVILSNQKKFEEIFMSFFNAFEEKLFGGHQTFFEIHFGEF